MGSYELSADQKKLVEQLAPLVKRIAYHFMPRLPASVHVDDLIQAGLMGLLDAAKNFDDTQGAQFETYAIQRIRGSILDELRQADWLPRNVRKNLRKIESAITSLEQRLGRAPREQELAEALGVALDDPQIELGQLRVKGLLVGEQTWSLTTRNSRSPASSLRRMASTKCRPCLPNRDCTRTIR